MAPSLETAVLRGVDPEKVDARARKVLREACRELDKVGRRDRRSGDVYVDEERFRAFVARGTNGDFADHAIAGLKGLPGSALRRTTGRDANVRWSAIANEAGAPDAPTDETIEAIDVTLLSDPADLRQRLKAKHPTLPDEVFIPERFNAAVTEAISRISRAGHDSATEAHNWWNDFWGCLQSSFGFWVALAVVAALAVLGWGIVVAAPFWAIAYYMILAALAGFGVGAGMFAIICLFHALHITLKIETV